MSAKDDCRLILIFYHARYNYCHILILEDFYNFSSPNILRPKTRCFNAYSYIAVYLEILLA